MSYKVLYRKYRPDDFDNVVGQKYTVDLLKKAIISGKHSHAYIFTGPRGTGKTSCAKLFAKALNCENPKDGNPCGECISCTSFKENPDIIEMDAASNNGVEDIRNIVDSVTLVPSNSKYKIYIIDEVHMLSTGAFNALLLTLEEPPEHVIFILATTDIQKVPITILSRCQRFDFKPISKKDIIDRLSFVCSLENISYEEDALSEIAVLSNGGMRDALGMLDQLSSDSSNVTYDMVSSYFGSVSTEKINNLITGIANNDALLVTDILDDIKNSGTNIVVLVEKIVKVLRDYAVDVKSGKVKEKLPYEAVISLILDLNESLSNSTNVRIDSFVLLEIILLKYINFPGNNSGNNSISKNNVLCEAFNNNENDNIIKNSNQSKEITGKIDILSNKKNDEIVSVINKSNNFFDKNRRINNCFSECSKDLKKEVSDKWSDFISDIKISNKSMYGLVKDIIVQAASNRYAIITAKNDSTNELVNEMMNDIEKQFSRTNNCTMRFVAISDKSWKDEVIKYSENQKNNIKYIYEEEEISDFEEPEDVVKSESNDLEDIASNVFGSNVEIE